MLDFWRDKDGYLLIEGRGVKPIDGVDYVGYCDNGEISVISDYFKNV